MLLPVPEFETPMTSEESVDFEYFRQMIKNLIGVNLSENKIGLVKARLRQRLNSLGYTSYSQYRKYLRGLPLTAGEWEFFINALTTNKTEWFRERSHFDLLVRAILPFWQQLATSKRLTVWCAASSTGEEAYTLALILRRYLDKQFDFEIIASDIDTNVLQVARNGVYRKEGLCQVPVEYHKSGFIFGTGEIKNWIKVRPEIKAKVKFQRVNLLERPVFQNHFDIIFCRNVLIYFDPATIEQVVKNLFAAANKESLLFVGHSESLQRVKTDFHYLEASIYAKGKQFERVKGLLSKNR